MCVLRVLCVVLCVVLCCSVSSVCSGNPKAFSGQPSDIVPSVCPGSSQDTLGPVGPGASVTFTKHLRREAHRRHPQQMPVPPQLAPLDVEEQQLYSELLLCNRAVEETHFDRLYPRSCPFGHYPKLMTIGDWGNAAVHLEQSVTAIGSQFGEDSIELGRQLFKLTQLHFNGGARSAALSVIPKVRRLLRLHCGPECDELLELRAMERCLSR